MLKIGWFSTGRGEGSRQLFEIANKYIQNGEIDGKIIFVFSNREPKEAEGSDLFFKLVQSYNIPLIYFSSKEYLSLNKTPDKENHRISQYRIKYDREVMRALEGYNVDICFLAGYMLIVGDEMCQTYSMLNLHPAIPGGPTGTWKDVIWSLIETKAGKAGAMIHLVTPELDRGPVITYCSYSITGDPFEKYWQPIKGINIDEIKKSQGENNELFRLIRQHGLMMEFPLIVLTLKALCNNEIQINSGRVFSSDGKLIEGYDLSNEVNNMISQK